MTQWKQLLQTPQAPGQPAPKARPASPTTSQSPPAPPNPGQPVPGQHWAPPSSPAQPVHVSPVRLRPGQLDALRVPGEVGLLTAIYVFDAVTIVSTIISLIAIDPALLLVAAITVGALWLTSWVSHRMLYWFIYGNSFRVTESQYPAIYYVVRQAAEALNLESTPTVFLLQGHGVVELFLAKYFSRRGMIIITSNLVDELSSTGDTRRLMMLVGRQLGHIAAKHYHWWFLKDVLGAFFPLVHQAYRRRCHFTADRIGLMVVGDLAEAKAALTVLTVGKTLQAQTNERELAEQRAELRDSWFAWLCEIFETYPYMIDRICALDAFQSQQHHSPIHDSRGQPIQSFQIIHYNFYSSNIGNFVVGNAATAVSY